jgi:hypothetical protein
VNLDQIIGRTADALSVGLENAFARINTVWGKEHYADGKHAIPKWHDRDYNPQDFSSASGWAVASTGVFDFSYWKHGDCLCMNIALLGTLAGNDPALFVRLPESWRARAGARAVVELVDAGAQATGLAYVSADDATVLTVVRTDRANFTAGSVGVNGQILLRTTN